MMLFTVVALALLSDPSATPLPAPEKPKLICREGEQMVGSHLRSGRRCKTAEQWQQEDARSDRLPPSGRITKGQGDALTKERPQ